MATRRSAGHVIAELAQEAPEQLAITCGDAAMTRLGLEQESNRLARVYQELGVHEGDFVTIGLPNSIELVVAIVATWKLGAVPMPMSSLLPSPERRSVIDLANPALVVGPAADDHPERRTLPAGFSPPIDVDDAPLPDRTSPARKAIMSGGSTGRPKLIVSGLSGIVHSNEGNLLRMQRNERQTVVGPLYHSASFNCATVGLFLGHHLVILPRFDAAAALDTISRSRISWAVFVPTMLIRMWRLIEAEPSRYDLSSIRVLWHMAAPCPAWLKEAWIDLLGPDHIFEMYGGTEGQAITVIDGRAWLSHRGSVGVAEVGEVIVLDEQGAPAPPSVIGEVFMRPSAGVSTYRCIGAEARVRDGWESIGDLGWMDEDGYLYLGDRRTDLIVTGGANVYPAEVEAAIDQHRKVRSSIVVGVPDEDLGSGSTPSSRRHRA